jgi:hypothetical protein
MMASSLCMLGVRHGDKTVLGDGRKLYGRALLQFLKELRSLSNGNRIRLIINARLLGLFEVC